MLNHCMLAGNLTKKQLVYLEKRDQWVCNFVIAVDNKWKGSDDKVRSNTTFCHCKAWGERGKYLDQYIEIGDPIMVEAAFMVNKYSRGGKDNFFPYFNVKKLRALGKVEFSRETPEDIVADFEDLEEVEIKKAPSDEEGAGTVSADDGEEIRS